MNFFDILKNFLLLSKEKLFGNCYVIDDAGVLNGSITLVRSVYAQQKDLQFSSKNHCVHRSLPLSWMTDVANVRLW